MELVDTIKGMLSDDYYERLKAEYFQAEIRYKKLRKYINNLNNHPSDLIIAQANIMEDYVRILRNRVELEGYYHDDRIK